MWVCRCITINAQSGGCGYPVPGGWGLGFLLPSHAALLPVVVPVFLGDCAYLTKELHTSEASSLSQRVPVFVFYYFIYFILFYILYFILFILYFILFYSILLYSILFYSTLLFLAVGSPKQH